MFATAATQLHKAFFCCSGSISVCYAALLCPHAFANKHGLDFPRRYLPTKLNKDLWKVESTLTSGMRRIVDARVAEHLAKVKKVASEGQDEAEDGTDLLQLMIEATEGISSGENWHANGHADRNRSGEGKGEREQKMSKEQMMGECMTFLLAGHETTSTQLSWTMLLLAQHPEWQERAREEVQGVFGNGEFNPSYDQLNELKVTGWILNEALRLYPPAPTVGRFCTATTKLTDSVTIPAGCDISLAISVIHRSKELWGDDASDFRPERFANGISAASKHPGAFIPFSLGPRICIGQSFAQIEAKAILSLLLLRFSWKMGASYRHHPDLAITLTPKHGMPIILQPID